MKTGRILLGVVSVLVIGLILVVIGTQRLAHWEVVYVRDPTRIEFAMWRITMNGPVAGDTLVPSMIITGLDSALTARLDGYLSLHMTPNSTVGLPPAPARWLGRHRTLAVEDGVVALSSGDRDLARALTVVIPAGRLTLRGTDLVVRCGSGEVEILQTRGIVEVKTVEGRLHRLEGEVGIRLLVDSGHEMIPVNEEAKALIRKLNKGVTQNVITP